MAEPTYDRPAYLALGDAAMDAMHREFVQCCAGLAAAGPEHYLDRLEALIAHCVAHFQRENDWMRTYSYPSAGCHISEHQTVLDVARDVRQRFVNGDCEHAAALAAELPRWFEHHVATMDAALAGYLKNAGSGAAAHAVAGCGQACACGA